MITQYCGHLRAAALASLPFAVLASVAPAPALAYVGPGAGMTAIGTVLALFAAIGLALIGFVWYPIKRLLKRPASASAPDRERREE